VRSNVAFDRTYPTSSDDLIGTRMTASAY